MLVRLSSAPFNEDDASGYAQGYAGYGQPPRRLWTGPSGYGTSPTPGAWPRAGGAAQYREQGEHRGKGPMGAIAARTNASATMSVKH